MKVKITSNILELKSALEMNGVKVTLDSYPAFCADGKEHFCTILGTDIDCGEDALEFVFHPQTGRLVRSCLNCPIVK